MKKLTLVFALIICVSALNFSALNFSALNFSALNFGLTPFKASAQSNLYLRITEKDLPFYADESGLDCLFFLPYTYYVKVINRGEVVCKIEYGSQNGTALVGYVPTMGLFEDGLMVEAPYPTLKIKTSRSAVLYADREYIEQVQYVFSGREMNFLGYSRSSQGVYACFVEYNGRIGYVKDADIVPFDLANHPNQLTFLSTQPTPDSQEQSSPNYSDLKYVIIACLIVAGLLGLLLVLKKAPKVNPAISYYDENDYE